MLRFSTAGESHGKCLTAILEGLPAGIKLDFASINDRLRQRQSGYGRGGRMRIEQDQVDFLSGVRFAETTGGPITLQIKNHDWVNWQDKMAVAGQRQQGIDVTAPRPGHADLAGAMKYARADIRDVLERSSARETAARVAVGAVCSEFLKNFDIAVWAHVTSIGTVQAQSRLENYRHLAAHQSPLNCLDQAAERQMCRAIDLAREKGDTLGGTFEVVAKNVPPGLGTYAQWDQRLDGRLAQAMMSIQAIKGVEIGMGFAAAALPGSEVHDEIIYHGRRFCHQTNHAGGIEGGMSDGELIMVRAAMKPIPTLMRPLRSVDIKSKQPIAACKERSDVCAVPAASFVGAAMVSFVLSAAMLEQFGGSCLADTVSAWQAYCQRLATF